VSGYDPDRERVVLDHQQALLLDVLRRAHGGPVSYQELRDAGIEYPASVVSELELAGLPLERCYEGPLSARRLLGVRLRPAHIGPEAPPGGEARAPALERTQNAIARIDLAPAATAFARWTRAALGRLAAGASAASRGARRALDLAAIRASRVRERAREARERAPVSDTGAGSARRAMHVRVGRASGRAPVGGAHARWLAPAALIAAAALVIVLALDGLGGGGNPHHVSAGRRPAGTSTAARTAHATAPSKTAPAPLPPTPVSPALAAQLEARGHGLLESGQFTAAVPVLQQALAATGERLAGCLEPVSETCLSYAYALYDLGRALLLDRQPAAAELILERRLQIANQRPVVQNELELARQEAGRQAPIAAASG
jgi:hypothetical protein